MTLLEKLNNDDRFANSIGAQLTDLREGYAKAELVVEERHLNGAGVCQGGVIYTLADLSFAGVANSHGILSLGISNTIHHTHHCMSMKFYSFNWSIIYYFFIFFITYIYI